MFCFSAVQVNGKYLSVCRVCTKTLANTVKSDFQAHQYGYQYKEFLTVLDIDYQVLNFNSFRSLIILFFMHIKVFNR